MRSLIFLIIGVAVGVAALGAVWANVANTPADPDGAVDVRIVLERLGDGRVEAGLQQRENDGRWGETLKSTYRFLPPHAAVGTPLHSSPVIVDTDSRYETVADNYAAFLSQSGLEIGQRYTERFRRPDLSDDEITKFLCIEDLNEPGIGALCDGFESGYAGPVERVAVSDYDAFAEHFQARLLNDRDFGGAFATSIQLAHVVDVTREAVGRRLTWTSWIELIDPLLPDPQNLYCVISHGSDADLFWGLASESAVAAAGALGMNLRNEVYFSGEEQAEGIRRCAADGAVAIATTLAEPAVLKPAVQQALAAGVPVISFNSGAEDAADVGTALHIALDDLEAGRVAGREFNARGVEGRLLCIIHEPENQGLHDRCDGLEETFNGTVERWSMTDRETTVEELYARIRKGDVNGVLALSSSVGREALTSARQYYRRVPVATFGFTRSVAEHVADGRMLFAIPDHPEIQSFLAAVGAFLAERFRIDPVSYFNSAQLLITPTVGNAEQMQAILDTFYE